MKNMFLLLSFVFGLSHAGLANATLVESVKIHADYYPDNSYSIGLDLDANKLVTQIYFDQDGEKTYFPLNNLTDFQTIMKVSGVTLVQMRVASHNGSQSAVVELNYTQNYISGNHASMMVGVNYNSTTGQYEVTDQRNNQIIHDVTVHTRYNFLRLPIGISSIETE